GIVTRAHIHYAERIWEEFTQSIHTFIEDKRNLGTKREVFGMPIPGSLITTDIQEASYYQEYLAKVAKHQRYLADETRGDPDSPASKPTKTARKPKPTAPKAHPRPSVSKPVSSTQPKPTSAPAKPQGKKRKLTTKRSHKPSKAIKSRHGFEPLVDDKEADVQRALEESMKSVYDVPRRPLPPVVIRKPESKKYQPLPKVPGKGKEKAGSDREHVDLDVADVSTQPPPEQLDEGFTATAYPEVQENLKLTVEEYVLLEEPASSSGTLSSLQHLTKDLSFGDLFFNDKPSEADNNKATAETEAESMIDLEHIMANLIQKNKKLEQRSAHILKVNLRKTGGNLLKKNDLLLQNQPGRFRHLIPVISPCLWTGSVRDEELLNLNIKTWKALHLKSSKSFILIKPLPLGGPPGQVTIQYDFFFNKDLKYLRYGSKGSKSTMSISKMKAAYYPDIGLEQMMPNQIWIEEECKYDIAAKYGISHWWFQRQRFYIDRHTSEGDRGAFKTHMRILSVFRIEVFSMYRYDYMKNIVLHRANLNEHVIAERDFSQNRRDLPREILLDSVEVLMYAKRSKSEIKGKVPTEMELILEHTQQGTSYEVAVSDEGVEELKRNVRIKGVNKEALHTLKVETESIHMLSETLSCCLVLKIAVIDPVAQCTTLP
nr:hypothetical protein [Tanacetum cinerariifolium]